MRVRVAIADDQPLVRDGFRVQLGLAGDMEFAGEASTGEQAVALARRERPDVLLMDVRMPVLDGIEATRRITADPRTSGVRVLVLTTFDIDQYVFAALRAGASGFLLKDVTPEELLAAIRIVAAGEALLAPAATRHLVTEFVSWPSVGRPDARLAGALTGREREVLVLIAQGLSNAEIAGRLVVSPATAKTHVSRILTKLGLRDRAQLVIAAYESGLITPGG
jgi:DNA-binding NarL/FixJ family response regulator